MKPAHRHAELVVLLDRIQHTANQLANDLRWGYSVGYGIGGSSDVKVHTSGADPIFNTISSEVREDIRLAIRRAGRTIDRVASDLSEAHSGVVGAMSQADPRQTPLPSILPRPATRAEVALARDAQQRRLSRGEGWGSG